eukprot:7139367-Karenia_brevis.AAC.1
MRRLERSEDAEDAAMLQQVLDAATTEMVCGTGLDARLDTAIRETHLLALELTTRIGDQMTWQGHVDHAAE